MTFWLVPLLMYLWRMPLFSCLTTVRSSQISHHSGCISCFRFIHTASSDTRLLKKLMLMKVYLTKWCPINCMVFFIYLFISTINSWLIVLNFSNSWYWLKHGEVICCPLFCPFENKRILLLWTMRFFSLSFHLKNRRRYQWAIWNVTSMQLL